MQTSPEVTELLTALAKARQEFDDIKKTKTNPHFHSSYAGLDDYLAAVALPLARHGLLLTGGPDPQEDGRVLLRTRVYHTSGQFIECSLVITDNGNPQTMGSHMTYARRFTLGALLGVAGEDDDDGETVREMGVEKRTSKAAPRASKTSPDSTPASTDDSRESAAKDLFLDTILAHIKQRWPGQDDASKEARATAMQSAFGVRSWPLIKRLSLDQLQSGYAKLQADEEDVPFGEIPQASAEEPPTGEEMSPPTASKEVVPESPPSPQAETFDEKTTRLSQQYRVDIRQRERPNPTLDADGEVTDDWMHLLHAHANACGHEDTYNRLVTEYPALDSRLYRQAWADYAKTPAPAETPA